MTDSVSVRTHIGRTDGKTGVAHDPRAPDAAHSAWPAVEGRVYRVDDPRLGRERLVRVTSMPLFGTDGAVHGSVTTFTDA